MVLRKMTYLFLLIALFAACTVEPDWSYPNTKYGNLYALWDIIDKKYCFVEEKGVDWQIILTEYEQYLDSVNSDRELFDLMADMLDNLHDGHVNLYSDFDISRNEDWYKEYPLAFDDEIVYSERYLGNYKIAGGMYYNLIATGKVGLIRYSSFSSGFSARNILYVLDYFSDCKGIVLDVRSNGGGSMEYAKSLASVFFSEPRKVGYWNHKTGEGHYDLSKPAEMWIDTTQFDILRWKRPVIVLCDRQSFSATNFFVSAMRYADNCMIVGVTTGGGGGMPQSYELPIGWLVRFSSIKMYDNDMQSIEEGIEPDVLMTQTSEDKDDLIELAIQMILDNDKD